MSHRERARVEALRTLCAALFGANSLTVRDFGDVRTRLDTDGRVLLQFTVSADAVRRAATPEVIAALAALSLVTRSEAGAMALSLSGRREKYWVYEGAEPHAILHVDSCGRVGLGKDMEDSDYYHGPYEDLSEALLKALDLKPEVAECSCCRIYRLGDASNDGGIRRRH